MQYLPPSPPARDRTLFPDAGLLNATFEGIDSGRVPGSDKAIDAMRDWCVHASRVEPGGSQYPVHGVGLVGDTGTGKTHLLSATAGMLSSMLPRSVVTSGYRVLLIGEIQLRSYIRTCWSNGTSADRLRNAIAGKNRSWLFLDDLGAARGDERFALEVADLLQRRHSSPYRNLTMVTTNLSLPQLEVIYGARVASRLFETLLVYKLNGTDQRSPTR